MHIIRYNTPAFRSLAPAFAFTGRGPCAGFGSEIDSLLGATLADFGVAGQFPVSLDEDKDNVYVRAELPGVNRQDINLELADGVLTIAAERKQKSGDKE